MQQRYIDDTAAPLTRAYPRKTDEMCGRHGPSTKQIPNFYIHRREYTYSFLVQFLTSSENFKMALS